MLTSVFFHQKSATFVISRNTDIDCSAVQYIIANSFNFFWVYKDCFDKDGYSFDDASKIGYSKRS